MNDYAFGNRICAERMKRGLSQRELGEMLGVTDKAVSKWENGKAKPTTDTLRKLAAVFGCAVEELLRLRSEERKPEITRIVITGGPCAGKTTGGGASVRTCGQRKNTSSGWQRTPVR